MWDKKNRKMLEGKIYSCFIDAIISIIIHSVHYFCFFYSNNYFLIFIYSTTAVFKKVFFFQIKNLRLHWFGRIFFHFFYSVKWKFGQLFGIEFWIQNSSNHCHQYKDRLIFFRKKTKNKNKIYGVNERINERVWEDQMNFFFIRKIFARSVPKSMILFYIEHQRRKM